MPKHKSTKALATLICKAVHELNGAKLHWVCVDDLCKCMKLRHSEALAKALEYAGKEGLLTCSPPPVHSVMLAAKGEMAARRSIRST
jgi:hypothetical protein